MRGPNLFLDPEDVTERLKLSTFAGVVESVGKAILTAQMQVEAILGFSLALTDLDCLYQLDSDAFSGIQPGGAFRLELPSGFIRPQNISLTYGSHLNQSLYSAVNSSYYTLDYSRGYLMLEAAYYRDLYVRVMCQSGFASTEEIPDAVKEAVLLYVPKALDAFSPKTKDSTSYPDISASAVPLLLPFIRNKGLSFRPL